MFDPPQKSSNSDGEGHRSNTGSGDSDSGKAGTSFFDSRDDQERQRKDLDDLKTWFIGLNATSVYPENPLDLCTGRAFAEILHTIDKDHFDENWVDTIGQYSSTANAFVKRSNLRKLWRKMVDYIHLLQREVTSNRWNDFSDQISGTEDTDLPIVLNFAMLIVTIALIGKTKQDFIEYSKLFSQTHDTQMRNVAAMITTIMNEIPESRTLEPRHVSHDESDVEFNNSMSENHFRGVVTGRSSLSDSPIVADLYQQLEEKDAELTKIKKDLVDVKKQLEVETAKSDGTKSCTSDPNIVVLEQINEDLKVKKREAEEKVNELEAQLDYFRPIVQSLQLEVENYKVAQKEIGPLKAELLSIHDDLIMWKDRAQKGEVDTNLLKVKERENKDLTSQVKMLNSRIEHYVKQSTTDEDNKSGMLNLRQHIGKLKGENDAKDMEIISKNQTIIKLEEELIASKEKVRSLDDKKELLITERNHLQEMLIKASENTNERSLRDSILESGNASFENTSSEKPRLALEVENRRLQERIEELELLEPLQGEIMTLKSRNGVLEQEYQVVVKQRNDLENDMKELSEKIETIKQNGSGEVSDLRIQIEKTSLDLERASETANKATNEAIKLEENLKTKTTECETLVTLLNKAKTVIDELEKRAKPVGADSGTSVQQFRELEREKKELTEKVASLQAQLKNATTTLEQENRLLTSASHQMVLDRNSEMFYSMPENRATAGGDEASSSANTSISNVATSISKQTIPGALSWRYE